jgi:hypothetical protein
MGMQISMFRRNVTKTMATKATKTALRVVSKDTIRTQVAATTVALKKHTGQLLQIVGPYLLGLPQTQEMKDAAFKTLGNVGFDLTGLARALKVKLPASTKRIKLVGTRGAALLQLDSLATDLLTQVEQGLFARPQMTTVTKMVPMPQKGGAKEERQVEVVDTGAEFSVEQTRRTAMQSFLTGALDVYWRLCLDMTGEPPAAVLAAKFTRMQQEYPDVAFSTQPLPPPKKGFQKKAAPAPVPAPKAKAKAKAPKAAEPVSA